MIARALMILVGMMVAAMGIGMTMIGIFAVVGVPMIMVGLALLVEGADPQS